MDERYNHIKQQFIEVIKYSQNIANPNVDRLFDKWCQAKSWFLNKTGGSPIYEYPEKVSFELDEKEKISRLDKFIETVFDISHNEALIQFIDNMRNCFFNNLTDSDYVLPSGKIIKKGTKIVRAFKYFEPNKILRTDIQNKASRIIQEDKISGTLCISVHPLDFLSSSENDHNWRSCHALDGDYRAGNLSYMTDVGTVMIYLRSSNLAHLPNFPDDIMWNSKKWRVLLFVSNDKNMLFLGRQYPFTVTNGANFITNKLLPKLNMPYWTEWTNASIDNISISKNLHLSLIENYIPVGGYLIPMRELVCNGYHSLQFNDLLYSSYYTYPYYCYKAQPPVIDNDFFYYDAPNYGEKDTRFVIGGAVYCLNCGRQHITNSATMICSACEAKLNEPEYGHCSYCGQYFYLDEGFYLDDMDEWVCPTCARTQLQVCSNCGELTFKDGCIYKIDSGYICPQCQQL